MTLYICKACGNYTNELYQPKCANWEYSTHRPRKENWVCSNCYVMDLHPNLVECSVCEKYICSSTCGDKHNKYSCTQCQTCNQNLCLECYEYGWGVFNSCLTCMISRNATLHIKDIHDIHSLEKGGDPCMCLEILKKKLNCNINHIPTLLECYQKNLKISNIPQTRLVYTQHSCI